jgi:hypothetical protein
VAPLFGLLLVTGCASTIKQYYQVAPESQNATLLPYSGTSQVYGSVAPDDDGARLAKDGYVRVGVSSFKTDGHVTFDELQAEAKEVGADIVLFSISNPETRKAVRPFAQSQDGTVHDLAPYVHVTGALTRFSGNYGTKSSVGGGMMDFNGKVTSSGIPGVSSATMADMNAIRLDYTATFWRRIWIPSVQPAPEK